MPESGRARLAFGAGVAVALLGIAALALVGGLVLFRHFSDETDPFAATQVRYQRQYDTCVRQGHGRAACRDAASTACIADPVFTHDEDAISDTSRVCLIFDDR